MSAPERMIVTLSYDAVDGRWTVAGSQSGPAGLVELWLLDDVQVLVDALEPERLVELTGTLAQGEATLPPPTAQLVAALLGRRVSAPLGEVIAERGQDLRVECEPTAALRAVGRLALLESVRTTPDIPSPWWAAEAAFLANQVDDPRFIAFGREEARQAAPMLAALARFPDRWAGELSETIIDRVQLLAGAVVRLLDGAVPAGEPGEPERQRRAISRLVEWLRRRPPMAPAEAAALEDRVWAKVRSRQRALGDDHSLPAMPVALPEPWSGAPDTDRSSFQVPLRAFREQIAPEAYRRFPPNGLLKIVWSPSASVQALVPVQPGTRTDELEDLFLRVFDADTGELLSVVELDLEAPSATGATASDREVLGAEAELPRVVTVDDRRRAPARLKVDLTSDPRSAPLGSDLRRRRRAIQAGMLAAAADRIGNRRVAEENWRACARHWHELGEHRQSRMAGVIASEAAARSVSAAPPQAASWFAGESLPVLFDAWADDQLAAAQRLAAADRPAAMELARLVIMILGPASPRAALAAARTLLAELLGKEGANWAAREQLRRALTLYRSLNYRQGTETCQRLLAELASAPPGRAAGQYAVGVSLLREELVGVLTDRPGRTLDVQRQPLGRMTPTEVADDIAALVRSLFEAGREFDPEVAAKTTGIGVELGGPVDHESGEVVFYSPYSTDPAEGLISDDLTWKRVPFARLLTEATGIESVVENDANALAVFERWFRHGTTRHFAVLLVGDGIGCGLVVDHKLYRGARGAAGEIGHIVVPGGGKCSSCEREGCLDSLASVRSILANIGGLKNQPPLPDLATAIGLLKKGDKEAWEAFDDAGNALAHATADVLNIHSPSRVVLRAPASMLAFDNPFVQAFRTFTRDRFLQIPDDPELILEPLRLADGARGAALLVLQRSER